MKFIALNIAINSFVSISNKITSYLRPVSAMTSFQPLSYFQITETLALIDINLVSLPLEYLIVTHGNYNFLRLKSTTNRQSISFHSLTNVGALIYLYSGAFKKGVSHEL
jgi:hypothetical protein